MRRPPSYSDSYHVLARPGTPVLEPFSLNEDLIPAKEIIVRMEPEPVPCWHGAVIFVIKGSLHIFFISTFETVFYFFFVSKSEDNGIKSAFNVYYTPLVQTCGNWSNATHMLLENYILYGPNKSVIDSLGISATANRNTRNNELLNISILYSVSCAFIFFFMAVISFIAKIRVRWTKLLLEHFCFVGLLGAYEYFFFRTIIYRYSTISTDEINQYIYDGIYQCLGL
jgi:hypothetical protein